MAKQINYRRRIQYRIRKKVQGTAERPRAAIFRSAKHFYIQVFDDTAGKTVASISTLEKDLEKKFDGKSKVETATSLGEMLGARLKDQKIASVVFDRGGYRYHGRVKAAADGLRSAGIKL